MLKNRISQWFRKAEAEAGVTPPEEPIRVEAYVDADPEKNEQYVRAGFLAKAQKFLTKLPMAEDVAAAYFCMLDPNTPKWVKGVTAAALAYFILPIDAHRRRHPRRWPDGRHHRPHRRPHGHLRLRHRRTPPKGPTLDDRRTPRPRPGGGSGGNPGPAPSR